MNNQLPLLIQMFFEKHKKELQKPTERVSWAVLYNYAQSELGISQFHIMTEWLLENVGNIAEYMLTIPPHFLSHSTLDHFDIPEHITIIEANAFSTCTNFTFMTIPKSVERIDAFAFNNCYNLKAIRFLGANTYFPLIALPSKDIDIYCIEGSHVHYLAKEYGFKCHFIAGETF